VAELRSHRLDRDAAVVSGPEAAAYLQGQLSQDVAGLGVGGSAWSWLLAPAGKVDALVRVTRTGPDTFVVDTDGGWGEAVVNRLTRFKLRTKADIAGTGVTVVALRGAGAATAAASLGAGTPVRALWRGEEAADVLVVEGDVPPAPGPALDGDGWEAARIVAGVPVMGAELSERTIPAETGLIDVTVSFTKGCYTGQELVARIDSRGGHVPRHLRLLRPASPVAAGAEIAAGGKGAGAVTSAADTPGTGPVALAYVGRAVTPGEHVDVGGVDAEVVLLGPIGG